MHVVEESPIADQCMAYALSEPRDSSLTQKCNHTHRVHCAQCDTLQIMLNEILTFVLQASFQSDDDRDEAIYVTRHSTEVIQAWKSHQLRTVRQDQSILQFLQQLDTSSVFITQDWAIKYLPRKYRESQSDWYGKRGISWHISVAVRRRNDHLESQGLIHVIQNCSQGSCAVVAIMAHVMKTLKQENPEIQRAFFRQDSAGCYHSAATVLTVPAIVQESGIQVVELGFSDPQGGKGPADRMAATIKGHLNRFVNEGDNITNAKEIGEAICSHGGIPGVRVAVLDYLGEREAPGPLQRITGIGKLNNFRYFVGGVRVWQAFDIGPGKEISS